VPTSGRTDPAAVPRALLEEAVAHADLALRSPAVEPVACLCGRSDTLVTYADMVIEVGVGWPGASAVSLLVRAARDLETALQLEVDDQRALCASLGDVHLSLYHAHPDPAVPSAAGRPSALTTALVWYDRAHSVPFKPFHSLEAAYNAATACALLGSSEDARCLAYLRRWLALLTEHWGSATDAAAVARTELGADRDFAALSERPAGHELARLLQ
jgi:hypothetical protein